MLIEQAGGRATTGASRILEVARLAAPAHRFHLRLGRGGEPHRGVTTPTACWFSYIRRCSAAADCSRPRPDSPSPLRNHHVRTHPIIAITGSSGAGTTSVTRTFENIFRREKVDAAVIEGDALHRYDRMAVRQDGRGGSRQPHLQPLRPEGNFSPNWRRCSATTPAAPARPQIPARRQARPRPWQEPGTFTPWKTCGRERLMFYEGLHGGGEPTRWISRATRTC